MWEEGVEGDVAQVHQSLLEPQRLLKAPYRPALGNGMFGFAMIFGAQLWAWIGVTVSVHVAMWLVTRKDIFALGQIREYLLYQSYYRVD